MDTIYSLLKRAKELKNKSQVDSITPEEVGKLHEDTLAYIASLEQSADGLGIKKVYQSKSAIEADTDPVGTNGKTLRYGQLVSIYDDAHADSSENGNIYAYQKPGWLLMGKVSGGTTLSITQELGDSATKVMSQAAVKKALKNIQATTKDGKSLEEVYQIAKDNTVSSDKLKKLFFDTKQDLSNIPLRENLYVNGTELGVEANLYQNGGGFLSEPIKVKEGQILSLINDYPRSWDGYCNLAEVLQGENYKVLSVNSKNPQPVTISHDCEVVLSLPRKNDFHCYLITPKEIGEPIIPSSAISYGDKSVNEVLDTISGKEIDVTNDIDLRSGDYLENATLKPLSVGVELKIAKSGTGMMSREIKLKLGDRLKGSVPNTYYQNYSMLAEVVGGKMYNLVAHTSGDDVTIIDYEAPRDMTVILCGYNDQKKWKINKVSPSINRRFELINANEKVNYSPTISEYNQDCEPYLDVMSQHMPYSYGGEGKINSEEYPVLMITTDQHDSIDMTQRAVDYTNEHKQIVVTISLGDTGEKDMSKYRDMSLKSKKPMVLVAGNHDMEKMTSEAKFAEQWYTEEFKNKLGEAYHQAQGKPYWYYDIQSRSSARANKKLRLIGLMEFEGWYAGAASNAKRISDEQYKWLCGVLDSCDENTYVVICKHYPMSYIDANIHCAAFAPIDGYRTTNVEGFSGNLPDIIDAWIHGKTVTFTNTEEITHSFSKAHKENFVCYISGHEHEDNCFTVQGYKEQVCLTFACTATGRGQLLGDLPRTDGKLLDCVTCLSYNWDTKHINLLRLGSNITADGRSRKYVSFKLPNID